MVGTIVLCVPTFLFATGDIFFTLCGCLYLFVVFYPSRAKKRAFWRCYYMSLLRFAAKIH